MDAPAVILSHATEETALILKSPFRIAADDILGFFVFVFFRMSYIDYFLCVVRSSVR